MNETTTFDGLIGSIENIHNLTSTYAKGAVNQFLTARNWMIGYYIVEYEQNGQDRAEYGKRLLESLSDRLSIKGLDRSILTLCRQFYTKYPQICDSVNRRLPMISEQKHIPLMLPIGTDQQIAGIPEICDSMNHKFQLDPEMLITRLSFAHIRAIIPIDDPLERFFYELECIKGTWSVRELRRQIDTKLFIRAGISKKPELLLDKIDVGDRQTAWSLKNVYALEFLDLNGKDEVTETDLEQAIMDHLQEFLLEMGKGFCFEARQRRILIDDEYYFIDLVLYNRILHCNVIIELKLGKFKPEYATQLNMYTSYYRFEEMTEGDNPPIGILLCTEKGPKMVQYVLNGMDENLFVSKYMLQLPEKEKLEEFLLRELKEMGI